MATVTVDSKLLATLRRLSPARVRVYDAADDSRDIAVPTRRRKWDQVISAIEARSWVRCELLDKGGAVLGYIDNEGPAGGVEDIEGDGSREARVLERYLGIMLRAQTMALTFRDKEHSTLLQTMSDMMAQQVAATQQLVKLYQTQVETAATVAWERATAEAGGDVEKWMKVAEAAPELMGKLAPLIQLALGKRLGGGVAPSKPSSPTNGHAK